MQITIDTNNLTALDKAVLYVLLDDGQPQAPAETEAAKPAPAKKAAAPAAPAKKAAAAKPAPEPEVEEDEADEAEAEVTMEDATKAATKLVSSGDAAKVKAALAKVGAKRVSEIDGAENLAKFVALLDA